MDPLAARLQFLQTILRALDLFITEGQVLLDDIDGDAGYGLGVSANKLASAAEGLYGELVREAKFKEQYMEGIWVQDEYPACQGYLKLMTRFKTDVVGALVDLAEEVGPSRLSRLLTLLTRPFLPADSNWDRVPAEYWEPGIIREYIPDAARSLEELLQYSKELHLYVEGRWSA